MKKIYKDRLLKLAKHLETGKLGHKEFNFSTLNFGKGAEKGCGTAGCALGECPIVFPRQWSFVGQGVGEVSKPCLKKFKSEGSSFLSAVEFFDIDEDEADHLFQPGTQYPNVWGGKELNHHATRKQVAANIRAFVARKETT